MSLCAPSMGALQMECKSPVGEPICKTTTTRSQLRQGNRPGGGRLEETGGPMNKNRIPRPAAMRRTGTTPRSRGFSRGGKCGGRAGKQRVLTWGDPNGATRRGVSRGRSTAQRAGKQPPEDSMSGRAKPSRNVPTAWRTPQPMKPAGEETVSAATLGSMGAFRSKT